ncbi:unnamed protein product [Effrenium voratum]|nr:unnamed protein product [Effrenium voratum]
MGAILSEPVTAMVVERSSSSCWSAAAVTMQGWRRTHEDAHILCNLESGGSQGSGVFAVLDGHGGSSAAFGGARFLEEQLRRVAERAPGASEASRLLQEAFIECDTKLRHHLSNEDRSGSTVVACIVTPSRSQYTVQLAHAGDSRAVLCRGGRLFCSKDHKPNREDETRRIEAAGGSVSQGPLGGGPMRVDGALAVSRALGDFHFKPAGMDPARCKVSVVPEVQTIENCASGDWVLLACDGIFDVMENEEVKDFIEDHASKSGGRISDGAQVCIDLLHLCLDRGSKDNCTACFIQFGEFSVRKSLELLQGPWRAASPEVQGKYAEFFKDHGFEAEALEMTTPGRRLSGSSKGKAQASGAQPSPAEPARRMATFRPSPVSSRLCGGPGRSNLPGEHGRARPRRAPLARSRDTSSASCPRQL